MRLERLGLLVLSVAATVAAVTAGHAADAPPGAAPPEAEIESAPVVLDGRVLFRVAGVSSLSAEQRAVAIRSRIEAIARDRTFPPPALRTVEAGTHVAITAGDRRVMGIVEVDARLEGTNPRVLAHVYRDQIQEAIEAYRRDRSPESLGRAALYAVGATVALAALVLAIIWLARRLDLLITQKMGRRIESMEVQSFRLLQAERIWGTVHFAVRALRALGFVALALGYLHFVLGLFPWTRGTANRLFDLVIGPVMTMGLALVGQIPNLIFLVILFFIVRFTLRVTRVFFDAVAAGSVSLAGFSRDWARPTYQIVRIAIVAFALVVAYPYIPGSGSAAFQGISIFLGVLLSLGGSSVIANLISGYTLIYRGAFAPGDRVKIGDVIGDVIEMRSQVTRLRSLKNEEVIVPNSVILNSQIVNYSSFARQRGLILHTTVGIGYETPWRQVEAILLMAADCTPGLLKDPPPFVRQRGLGDFAVQYEINAYCADPQEMMALYTALHRNILDGFNQYGIQIMTPAYEGDPERPKVVPKEQWHAAPAPPEEPDGPR
jgi:small-conductance mechanosensitive channel